MRAVLRWRVLIVALVLLVLLAPPALGQEGRHGRVVFGQSFTLRRGEVLDGDLVVMGGNVVTEPDSAVRGAVLAFGGSVEVGGRVDSDVFSLGGDVRLGETAYVGGNVTASGEVRREPGATVRGRVMNRFRAGTRLPLVRGWGQDGYSGPRWWFGWPWGDLTHNLSTFFSFVASTLAFLAIGALVVLLAPGPTRAAGDALIVYPLQSMGVGLLTGLAAILVVPLLVITCIGIPVAGVLVLALAIAVLFGWTAAGLALGERLLVAAKQAERPPLLAMTVGLLLLALVSNAWCLGFLVAIVVSAWGLGGAVLTRFGTTPYVGTSTGVRPAPPAAPRGPEPPAEPPRLTEAPQAPTGDTASG